ncbi:MAG: T9SS type A sorting domain-containing protein [Ignavibacteriae bacterium]|nr:T9SS type A sorting domain-containing protein [Ignavibacteria bacterium]MBI3364143.1 T9SS type A sorting domain-containing protein [Ignavibacteriota bacterium]
MKLLSFNRPVTFVFFALVILGNVTYSQDTTVFRDKHGKRLYLEIDKKTGGVRQVHGFSENVRDYGFDGKELTKEKVDIVGRKLFDTYSRMFGISSKDLAAKRIYADRDTWYAWYSQVYEGIPVEGSSVGFMILRRNGDFVSLGALRYANVKAPTTPAISSEQAIEIAKRDLLGRGSHPLSTDLVIFPEPQGANFRYHLAWKILLNGTTTMLYYVSATDGRILEAINHRLEEGFLHGQSKKKLVRARPPGSRFARKGDIVPTGVLQAGIYGQIVGTYWPRHYNDPSVNGLVIGIPSDAIEATTPDTISDPDPVSSDLFGDYEITMDGDNPPNPLPADTFTVAVYTSTEAMFVEKNFSPYVPGDCSTYNVAADPHSNIDFFHLSKNIIYTPPSGLLNFDWTTLADANAADATNILYHGTRMRNFFQSQSIGYQGWETPYAVYVNEGTCVNGAADGSILYFGSNANKAWARSEDVITHESTHNVVYEIFGGQFIGQRKSTPHIDACATDQSCAMDEGLADYFSCTFSGEPGQATDLLTGAQARTMSNLLKYPTDYQDLAHHDGQIIGGACWNLRANLGAVLNNANDVGFRRADVLVLKALQTLPIHPFTFPYFLADIYDANTLYYDQQYDDKIKAAFDLHGVFSGQSQVALGWNMSSVPADVSLLSPDILYPGHSGAVFYFDGNTYKPVAAGSNMSLGIGYWVKFGTAQVIYIPGSEITAETITVSTGWNLIGSISTPVPAGSITSIPPGMITSHLFGYSGAYKSVDTLTPGSGYWIEVTQEGELILGGSGGLAKTSAVIQALLADTPPAPPDAANNAHPLSHIPQQLSLEQNYPNPFNPTTSFNYALPAAGEVSLRIYNMLGEEVATVVNRFEMAGYKSVGFDASSLASGMYFYQLHVGKFTDTKKMMLVK